MQLQLPPTFDEPAGQEATHLELLQMPDAQSVGATHAWPLVARHEPPTSCVVEAGQLQLLAVAFQTDPVGVWQTHPCDPYPWIDDDEPEAHAMQGGWPLRAS